jgi:DNA processing protein
MEEHLLTLALTRIRGLSQPMALALYKELGSAKAVFDLLHQKENLPPLISPKLLGILRDGYDDALKRAQEEVEFCKKGNIRILALNDEDYPARLKEIQDPPLVLFFLGNANLNAPRVISIVGTRRISEYGKSICHDFLPELKQTNPDTLVVSGLAYGVDIHTHRACLASDLPTVGILAHGLDMIYPSLHRTTAQQMLKQGGLLTEYFSRTNPDKGNFVRRNRIVAGMSEATVVVESAEHGGALITANLAHDYNREVFAFPGRINDQFSAGCNKLIAQQKANLITCAKDITNHYNDRLAVTKSKFAQSEAIEEKRIESTGIEAEIANVLTSEPQSMEEIAQQLPYNASEISTTLLMMELTGKVIAYPGGKYSRPITQ